MAELIKVEAVRVSRGDEPILNDIDWTVQSGQHWVLMGPNGSGKTTLLNIITGYLWPTRGSVAVLGQRFGETDLRELRRHLGWVSAGLVEQLARHHREIPALDVVMSGVDAAIGLYRERSPDLSPRAWQLLEWLGMTGLAERPFGILSQGERQRVVLARAWMANPQILILDEPTTGLDLVARERLLEGLTALVDEGGETSPVLVYVTHQIDEVLPWFTHGLLLRSGRIVEKGEKSAVIANGPLQQAFGLPVELVWRAGRPFVTLV